MVLVQTAAIFPIMVEHPRSCIWPGLSVATWPVCLVIESLRLEKTFKISSNH